MAGGTARAGSRLYGLPAATPPDAGYVADAFRALANEGIIDDALATRLARAAGFRNLVAHAYETLDMAAVHAAATTGPSDLRTFLAALARLISA